MADIATAAKALADILGPQIGQDPAALAEQLTAVGTALQAAPEAAPAPLENERFAGVHQAVSDSLGGFQPNEAEPPEHLAHILTEPSPEAAQAATEAPAAPAKTEATNG